MARAGLQGTRRVSKYHFTSQSCITELEPLGSLGPKYLQKQFLFMELSLECLDVLAAILLLFVVIFKVDSAI
jgi:hypothetical protein